MGYPFLTRHYGIELARFTANQEETVKVSAVRRSATLVASKSRTSGRRYYSDLLQPVIVSCMPGPRLSSEAHGTHLHISVRPAGILNGLLLSVRVNALEEPNAASGQERTLHP
jgi:hypothetical protein